MENLEDMVCLQFVVLVVYLCIFLFGLFQLHNALYSDPTILQI